MSWIDVLRSNMINLIPATIGLILAIRFFHRSRTAALLTTLSCALAWTTLLVSMILRGIVSTMFIQEVNRDALEALHSISLPVFILLEGSITLLLVAAVFVDRKPPALLATDQSQGANISRHRGMTTLILSWVFLLLFPSFAITTLVMGVQDLRAIGRGDLDSAGRRGMIIGVIVSAIALAWFLIALIASIWIARGVYDGSIALFRSGIY